MSASTEQETKAPDTPDATDADKNTQRTIQVLCASAFLSVLQHVIQLQAEPLLLKRLSRASRDPVARAARIMANTSGIVGIVGIFVNQLGGKLSDALGRKQFWYAGPLFSVFTGLAVRSFSNNLFVVALCRCLRLVTTTFSASVMLGASLSDVASGKVLAAASAKLGACFGAAIVIAPILEGIILRATKQSLTAPALGLAALGAIHCWFLSVYMPETNADVLEHGPRPASSVSLLSLNPLKFLSVYQEDPELARAVVRLRGDAADFDEAADDLAAVKKCQENRRVLRTMVTTSTFQSFLEGKNVSDISQIWQGEHLGWDVFGKRDFTVVYGALCVAAGAMLTPRLLKSFSHRAFTTLTNATNTVGFVLRGATELLWVFWACVPIMLPGVNGASSAAVKALATERAIASGIGRGELSAYLNNLRAIVSSVAPMLYGNSYAFFRSRGIYPGLTFTLAALVGGLAPELLLRTLPASAVSPLSDADKAQLARGLATVARMRRMHNDK